jgi:hypothetical protein
MMPDANEKAHNLNSDDPEDRNGDKDGVAEELWMRFREISGFLWKMLIRFHLCGFSGAVMMA